MKGMWRREAVCILYFKQSNTTIKVSFLGLLDYGEEDFVAPKFIHLLCIGV